MNIQLLTPVHAQVYQQLRLRALREVPEAFGSSFEEERDFPLSLVESRLDSAAAHGERFVLGAFDAAGTMVGLVGFFRESHSKMRHKATIWGTYVIPEVRGQGVGRMLMQEVLKRAHEFSGLEQIHLSVVSTNAGARALYDSLGFQPYGLEPHGIKIDDTYFDEVLMVLFLAPHA
ncbi:N-acetyltransferase [Dictyobacter alpinus]|uniref:N-acetyltransferase n=1 Tax=Dictyobacter alpinus TaxID=2014873 RepID=A0A402BBY1_9CHLR|nr:GNAT family N-acetyltransferase [Dictyobacter alpinus]GCE28893.1 N-acetyltransferase [Dictyobacter alpinus]